MTKNRVSIRFQKLANVAAILENILRAIAVVTVDVGNCGSVGPLHRAPIAQRPRRVHKAIAAEIVGPRYMVRRAA